MIRRARRLAAVAFGLAAFGSVAAAQAPDLVQLYQADGWSILYPAGWVVLADRPPFLGTEPAMMEAAQRGDPLPDGGISVAVLPSFTLPDVGMEPAASVEGTAQAVAAGFNEPDQPAVALADWPFEAYAVDLSQTSAVDGELHTIAALTPDGEIVAFVVQAADVEAVHPLLQAMFASFAVDAVE
jgi:hypothetical protein